MKKLGAHLPHDRYAAVKLEPSLSVASNCGSNRRNNLWLGLRDLFSWLLECEQPLPQIWATVSLGQSGSSPVDDGKRVNDQPQNIGIMDSKVLMCMVTKVTWELGCMTKKHCNIWDRLHLQWPLLHSTCSWCGQGKDRKEKKRKVGSKQHCSIQGNYLLEVALQLTVQSLLPNNQDIIDLGRVAQVCSVEEVINTFESSMMKKPYSTLNSLSRMLLPY